MGDRGSDIKDGYIHLSFPVTANLSFRRLYVTPFQKKDYYVPSMRGSYSIKYVLPSLVPEMAQAYKELDGVQNGGEAMQTYAKLAHMEDKEEVQRLREALLRYCELDTLAMVKVLEKLKESVK